NALPVAEIEGRPGFLTRHRRPLLLAATLLAVSMLALNLMMQRPAPPPGPEPPPPPASENVPAVDALPSEQPSSLSPRVIDMIAPVAVGSINPGASMTFPTSAKVTPMPSSLMASARSETTNAGAPDAATPEITGSIPDTAEGMPEVFELPPDAVG